MIHYCYNCGAELNENQLNCPKCGHCCILDELNLNQKFEESNKDGSNEVVNTVNGVLTAQQIEKNTQWTKYRTGPCGRSGHGFAAEDANALNDVLQGKDVDLSGRDNSKYGPDRIVDGQKIQTKYCKTAQASVNAGFDPNTGMYAYEDQILEVPSDQYDDCVQYMRDKIAEGKVPGHTDPNDASKIIKKGDVTYLQAKNIAKAGNIDSLLFDAKTQTITALSAFGISFAINLGMLILFHSKNKDDIKTSMKSAFLIGLENGTIAMSSGILTSQLLRTQFGRNFAAAMQWGAKESVDYVYQFDAGKELIHKLVKTLFNRNFYGGAAKNAATKFLRTNVIGNVVLVVVVSVPDAYHCLRNEMSVPQFVENMVVSGTSIAAGTLGAFLGSALGPAGMIGGGLACGVGFAWTSKRIARYIRKDDTEKMYQLIRVALLWLSHDYMIQNEEEFNKCINAITNEGVIDSSFIRAMYSIGKDGDNDLLRVQIAYEKLEYFFGAVIRQRKTVCLLKNQKLLLDCINELGEELKKTENNLKEMDLD